MPNPGNRDPLPGSGSPFLPYGRQTVDDDDVAAVTAVLNSDWLTTGPAVSAFETSFADAVGAPFAVACSSGTAALHMAAAALELKGGDRVVVPATTFLATANAARYVGAEVVFADVDAETGLMGADDLRTAAARAPEGSVKAAVPVHLNGQCVPMASLATIAEASGFRLVEDACHAIGATYGDGNGSGPCPVGSCRHSAMAVFSLHPVKTITMGEGGVVTTADPMLDDRLQRFRNHGIVRANGHGDPGFANADLAFDEGGQPNPWYYEMPDAGFNYRASDLHCALGLSQLRKLRRFVDARAALVRHYDAALASLAPVVRPIARAGGSTPAWHLYVVLVDFDAAGVSRADVMRSLASAGVGSQVHYMPVHLQPYYRRRYGDLHLPGALAYYRRCLSLPLFPSMTDADVERVVTALGRALG